jgi:hypothetical protein
VKRLNQLRPADLDRVPVWRYEGTSDDDAVVHATDRIELSEQETDLFIARTQFVLANGSQHTGFCSPSDDSGLDYMQPAILTAEGPVYFWFDRPPTDETLQAQWRRLGVRHENIFPVHFRCTVPVHGRYVTGVIESDDLTGAA